MTKTEIEAIEIAALLDNADAQYQLGRLFQNGDGVPKNLRESYKWFLEAAGRGHCDAMYQLGLCYQFGHGITKDIEKAASLYAKAECGSMKARHALFALQNPNLMKPCTQHYLDVRTERRDYAGRYSVGIDYIVNRDGTVELLPYGRIPENTDRQTLDEEDLWGIGHFAREYGRFGSYPLTPDT